MKFLICGCAFFIAGSLSAQSTIESFRNSVAENFNSAKQAIVEIPGDVRAEYKTLSKALNTEPKAFVDVRELDAFQKKAAQAIEAVNAAIASKGAEGNLNGAEGNLDRPKVAEALLAASEVMSRYQPVLDQIAELNEWNARLDRVFNVSTGTGLAGLVLLKSVPQQVQAAEGAAESVTKFWNIRRKVVTGAAVVVDGVVLYYQYAQIQPKIRKLEEVLAEQVRASVDALNAIAALDAYMVSHGSQSVVAQFPNLKRAAELAKKYGAPIQGDNGG